MSEELPARRRILNAAFEAFMESGYGATSTLEIARRARVSKRELYALVGNKQEMLVACIQERSQRLQAPSDLPEPRNRETLESALVALGTRLLTEVTDPIVVAVFRLAIAEAVRAPEVSGALDSLGRRTGRGALVALMTAAVEHGVLDGVPAELAEQFSGLLWGDLMVSLLLRTVEPPGVEEIDRRARAATSALLRIHP